MTNDFETMPIGTQALLDAHEREVRALMLVINDMRRTGNSLVESWADRIQDAVEDAANGTA